MQDVRLSGQQIVASGFTRRTKTTKIWDQINAINVWQSFTVCTIYFQDVGGCQSCRHKKSARVLRLWQKRSYEHFVQQTRLSTNSSNPLVILAIFPASFCDGKKRGKIRLLKLAWTIFWLVWPLSTLVFHDIAVQVTSSMQSVTRIIWCYAAGFPCQCSKPQTLQNL